ncbi:MAG: GAF domain-containing protein [Cyanobacteria bacterium P01_F01_bin.86]
MDAQGFDEVLDVTLRSITFKLGQVVNADRTTIFLLDREHQEFWPIVAESGDEKKFLEIRVPMNQGIVGEVAARKIPVNIAYDFYEDPRSAFAQQEDLKNDYRTYTLMALPLLNRDRELVAVIQVLNKLKPADNPHRSLAERIDPAGFTEEDMVKITADAKAIQLVLDSICSHHKTARGQRVTAALMTATRSLETGTVDPTELLRRIIDAARDLMNADRGTLWLLDAERQSLWTYLPMQNDSFQKVHMSMGQGFAGKVAVTGKGLNIPFDLYDHPESANAQATDHQSGYRTYSLLCLPILNPNGELIGVTQLVNKQRSRHPVKPLRGDQSLQPEWFYTSFDDSDRKCLRIFNNQVGAILHDAELLATMQ